jgi:hypothetical protein
MCWILSFLSCLSRCREPVEIENDFCTAFGFSGALSSSANILSNMSDMDTLCCCEVTYRASKSSKLNSWLAELAACIMARISKTDTLGSCEETDPSILAKTSIITSSLTATGAASSSSSLSSSWGCGPRELKREVGFVYTEPTCCSQWAISPPLWQQSAMKVNATPSGILSTRMRKSSSVRMCAPGRAAQQRPEWT